MSECQAVVAFDGETAIICAAPSEADTVVTMKYSAPFEMGVSLCEDHLRALLAYNPTVDRR